LLLRRVEFQGGQIDDRKEVLEPSEMEDARGF
jgi:hypothetical protein